VRVREAGGREGDQEDKNEFTHAHCSWRTTSCARLSPRMISTVGSSGAVAATAFTDEGPHWTTWLRATAVRVAAPKPKSADGRTPGLAGMVSSSGLRSAS